MGDFMLEDDLGMIYLDKILDDKYSFKQIRNFDYNVWGELLSSEIARVLGIPCIQYRACIFQGKKGVISRSFLEDSDTLILGDEIFKDYYDMISFQNIDDFYSFSDMNPNDKKNCIFHSWNQLDSVYSILCSRGDIDLNHVKMMDNFLTKMLLFDLLTLQNSRYFNKWGFIKKQDNILPCPLFDNSVSFGLGIPYVSKKISKFCQEVRNGNNNKEKVYDMIYQFRPKFVCSSDNILNIGKMENDTIYNVFQTLLEYVDKDSLILIQNFLEFINQICLEDIIHELEKKNGITMNKSLLFYVSSVYRENITNLNNIFKNFKENSNK